MNLTIIQRITVFLWFMFDVLKHEQYIYWLNLGLQPKYAFKKVNITL